jgi:hypothetical protein
MANVAGRMADKGLEQATTLAGAILMLLGWLCLWLGGSSIWGFCWVCWWWMRLQACTSATRTWSMHWRPRHARASMPSI